MIQPFRSAETKRSVHLDRNIPQLFSLTLKKDTEIELKS